MSVCPRRSRERVTKRTGGICSRSTDPGSLQLLGGIAVWDRSIAPVGFSATGLSNEGAGCPYGGGETGRRPDAERSAGTEFVGDPPDDWCADRRAPEPYANAKRNHSPAHGHPYRTIILSSIGTILECYDFIIFVFFIKVLSQFFFPPSLPQWVAQIETFGIFATGYLAQPLGGIVVAHYGDLLDRKKMFMRRKL